MSIFRLSILISLGLLASFNSFSQNYQWAKNVGGSGNDKSNTVYTDNNGFVYIVGYFRGTVDFDPSVSGVANLSATSAGQDAFVAKYTTAGQYVWAFKIGGSGLDEANSVTVDPQGNVYIIGFFRGANVDFDPSPTGVAILNSNGDGGGDPGYGGDIFIAKYNSAGQYLWAFNVGGSSLGDNGMTIVSDDAGNIYTSGYFRETPDFDPSPTSTKTLSASIGTNFVAKYNTQGQYQWAFCFGLPNQDNAPFGMKIDASSNIYLTGFFQGTSIDFDPSPTATAYLTSKGGFDVYVAKYTSNGNYSWAFGIGGGGLDVGRDIEIDNAGNVYVAGDFDGSNVDFDPSPTGTALLSSNNRDVFIAKYNSTGQYQWAKRFGASGSDISWSVAHSLNNIYITGSFQGTMNFSPGPTVDNLVSNGANDFFITKFDLNGNYICAFNVGGSGNEDAYRIDADNIGNLYTTGIMSSSNVDFDPGTGVSNLTTNGGSDIFLAKYSWPDNSLPATGIISGNSICSGQQGQLTFTASSGTGPFTIQYSDGVTIFTQTNVQSGIPFNLSPNPTTTTNYNLVSIRDALRCSPVNMVTGISASVNIFSAGSLADFSYVQNACNPKAVEFRSFDGVVAPTWSFGDATSGNGLIVSKTYVNYGSYPVKLKVQTSGGCVDSVTKTINISLVQADQIVTSDTTICKGSILQLFAKEGEGSYCWKPDTTIQNPLEVNAVVTPLQTNVYYFNSQITLGPNLVQNGNFSSGSAGFTSDYSFSGTNTVSEQFGIQTSPALWNGSLPSCTDHTTGAGNMMLVRSSAIKGKKIWSQTLTIQANTNYVFSYWVQPLSTSNLPSIQFSIKGQNFSGTYSSPASQCTWGKNYIIWNSGNNTSVNVALTNSNTNPDSYFALDDILFAQVSAMTYDSVKVNVVLPPSINAGSDTAVCKGSSLQLNATGGTTYNWFPSLGLNNPNISNPLVTVDTTSEFIVSGYNMPGCIGKDTIKISVLPKPIISKTNDTSICVGSQLQLNVYGGSSYVWSPSIGLSATNIANPIASPIVNTKYFVDVTASNGCSSSDSIMIGVSERPVLTKGGDTSICRGSSVQLFASANMPVSYLWSPATGLNNANISNPIASPNDTTTYIVTASSSIGCFAQDSIKLSVLNTPVVSKTGDTSICVGTQIQLNVSGGSLYSWSPSAGLNSINTPNPIASPIVSTKYYVVVSGTNGCFSKDSILIGVSERPLLTKGSDTSICRGSSVQLFASANIPVTYLWTPANGLDNPNIANPLASPTDTTTYIVTASSSTGCFTQDSIKLSVLKSPVINKSNDTTICSGGTANLVVTGGGTYLWTPAVGLSDNTVGNPVATPTTSTKYIVQVATSNGCSIMDSIKVDVVSPPAIFLGADKAVCIGDSIQLNASGAAVYNWFPSAGLNNANISNPQAKIDSTIDYVVSGYNLVGCVGKDTIKISALAKPVLSVTKDTAMCAGQQVQLNATGGTTFSWLPGTGLNASNIPNPVTSPLFDTRYYVTVFDTNGCSSKDSVYVAVKNLPILSVKNDTTVCAGSTVQLFVISDIPANYIWSPVVNLDNPNISNPVAIATNNIIYHIKAVGNNGCSKTDSVTLTLIPKPNFGLGPVNPSICMKDTIQLNAFGGGSYTWLPNTSISGNIGSAVKVFPTSTTKYSVIVVDTVCQVRDTLSTIVGVKPLPNVSISKSNDIDCFHNNSRLVATGGLSYAWSPSNTLNSTNTSSPVASPTVTTTYSVKVTNNAGCAASDTITVKVNYTGNAAGFELPSAFTPNNDGKNDCFGIRSWGPVSQLQFSVFNRWGERVFYASDASNCWDGNYKGVPQQSGAFVYMITATTVCGGEINKKGTVVLIR